MEYDWDKIAKKYSKVPMAVLQEFKRKCIKLKLDPEYDISIIETTEDRRGKKYIVIITREAYRGIAHKQADYRVCYALPIYAKDEFHIDKDGLPTHKFGLDPRGDLVGAYGILFKEPHYIGGGTELREISRPIIQYVKLEEFSNNKGFWSPTTGMQSLMICKVAEVQVLRSGYAELFGGTYSEAEISSENGSKDKGQLLLYCIENAKYLKDGINVDLNESTIVDLRRYEKIIEEKKKNDH